MVVHDDTKRRGFWKLGKVEKTLPGRDGLVRGAVVRVYTGGKRSKLFRRPLPRLYPLEVSCEVDTSRRPDTHLDPSVDNQSASRVADAEPGSGDVEDTVGDSPLTNDSLDLGTSSSRRPRRLAAIEARDRIVAQTLN